MKPSTAEAIAAFRIHAAVFAATMVMIFLVNLLTNLAAGISGEWSAWWSAWALMGWGMGLAVHGLVVKASVFQSNGRDCHCGP